MNEMEYLWKWFEIHVSHRKNMQNFLLVAVGIFAVAYTDMIKDANISHLARYLAIIGAAISFSFFMLDIITMKKITSAKLQMERLTGISNGQYASAAFLDLLNDKKCVLLRDRLWAWLIEVVITLAFVIAAIWGKS